MKKIILILAICLLLVGCNKKNKPVTTPAQNETNTTVKTNDNSTVELEENNTDIIGVTLSDKKIKIEESTGMPNLFDKLVKQGRELYKNKSYTNFEKRNEAYFISLKNLKKDYNFDISSFKGEDGTVCDIDNSGIYFDVDNRMGVKFSKDEPPVVPMLIGCSKSESKKNISKLKK